MTYSKMNISYEKVLQKMVTFIEQDALEKVMEIDARADEEASIVKAELIRAGCMQVQKDYDTKLKNLKHRETMFVTQKMTESKMQTSWHIYENYLNLVEMAKQLMRKNMNEESYMYEHTLRLIMEQGLLRVHHHSMTIFIQEKDLAIAKKLFPNICKYYKDATKMQSSIKLNTDEKCCLHPEMCPTVIVTSCKRDIMCEITMENRLEEIARNMMPELRRFLLKSNAS